MIQLNSKLNKFTLKATTIKNKEKSFENKFKWFFDLKQEFNSGNFYKHLRNYFNKIDYPINIDLNSFLIILNKKDHQSLVNVFFSIHEFIYNLPYSLKTDLDKKIDHNFIVDYKKYRDLINEALIFAECEQFARKLQLLPNNQLNPNKFVELVKDEINKLDNKNLKIEIFNKKELIQKKMNLILGVGAGSNEKNSPKLLSISLNTNHNAKKLVLIGKGVTFDTGGISLKPSTYMEGMQYDMSGAAIVVGTILALAKSNAKVNLVILTPLVVNDIGNEAIKVSDIITSYSKQTVEITNTDAEGRLILADAVTYAAKDLKADTILTIATLTGAVEFCFSDVFTPFWFTNEKQYDQIKMSANIAGELIWQMPFHFEYANRLKKSRLADFINSEKTRGAGSCVAAEFISFFKLNSNFIHADIASTNEFNHQPLPIMLRTLFYFAKNFK